MPIRSFKIENQKSLLLAESQQVPSLMVIAGPNGAGKSTLLFCLKRKIGGKVEYTGRMLYLPPHRTWRRQNIRQTHLYSKKAEYRNVLELDNIQSLEGMSIYESDRTADSSDESARYIKYAISQLETRRQQAIVSAIDSNGGKYPNSTQNNIA